MTDKEKIRAEVERRYNYHKEHSNDWASSSHFWNTVEDKEILSFIDSLQEEYVNEDLKKEINRYIEPLSPEDIKAAPFCSIEDCARHFAEWQKDNTIRKVVKWFYANFYISKEYVSETSILPIPKYAHNATMGQFISEFIKHMKKG